MHRVCLLPWGTHTNRLAHVAGVMGYSVQNDV